MRITELLRGCISEDMAPGSVDFEMGPNGPINSGEGYLLPPSPVRAPQGPQEEAPQPATQPAPADNTMRQIPAENPEISDHPDWRPPARPQMQFGSEWTQRFQKNPLRPIPANPYFMNPYKLNPQNTPKES
jgi:hypothetical protein